jgi:hypothetical protein
MHVALLLTDSLCHMADTVDKLTQPARQVRSKRGPWRQPLLLYLAVAVQDLLLEGGPGGAGQDGKHLWQLQQRIRAAVLLQPEWQHSAAVSQPAQ